MNLECRPLDGRFVRLEPLAETHREALRAACEADTEVWARLYPYSMAGEHFEPAWRRIAANVERGHTQAYAVLQSGGCVGLSCCFPDFENRSTEIGGTYYRPEVRGGPVNPDCKRLMLAHAFDGGAIRVQFKVDALNDRSRAAVLKLGAVQEGILRHDRITWTGRLRDTVFFSILAHEWPAVRERLDARLAAFETGA